MIRAASADDVEAIALLEADCFGAEAWSTTLVRAEIEGETRCVIVDDVAGVIRAYASLSVVGDVGDLHRIAVTPSVRRHGLAHDVLSTMVARAADLAAERILLEVADGNSAAIALYQSFGFATISRRPRYYADGGASLVMQLDLEETR